MEDAGPSVDNGDEEQEGQHGELPGTSLGLEMMMAFFFFLDLAALFLNRLISEHFGMSVCM